MTIIQGGVTISGFVQFTANYEPGPPTALTATWTTTATNTVSLKFTPPANPGSGPVTSYSAVSNPAGFTATVAANTNTIVIPGLSSSTYYVFNMYATNFAGNSALSTSSNIVYGAYSAPLFLSNYAVPAAPTLISAIGTATNTTPTPSALVKFLPGASAIPETSYTVLANGEVAGISTALPTTSYSGYFNGSSYLNLGDRASYAFGTGNFTIEAWVYPTASVTGSFVGSWLQGGNDHGIQFSYQSSGNFQFFYKQDNSNSVTLTTTDNAYPINRWYHVAMVRTGTTFALYVNGGAYAASSFTGTGIIETQFWLGVNSPVYNTAYFNGYISNVRFVKGLAVYNGTFAVPTAPLTPTQNARTNISAITTSQTTMLTLQNSSSIVDNSTDRNAIGVTGVTIDASNQPFDTFAYVTVSNLNPVTSYVFRAYATSLVGIGDVSTASSAIVTYVASSSTAYTFPGTYSWIAPADVTSVSTVVVGGGGSGRNGAASSGAGGQSSFWNSTVLAANGGAGGAQGSAAGGSVAAGTGFAGGQGGAATVQSSNGGGGGAGGYISAGGAGATGSCAASGTASTSGGGGGANVGSGQTLSPAGGGGVGLFGSTGGGPRGVANCTTGIGTGGGGGSGGLSGGDHGAPGNTTPGAGGLFGGGGGGFKANDSSGGCGGGGGGGALAYKNNITVIPGTSYTVVVGNGGTITRAGAGGSGGVRVVWPGQVRAFPSTALSGCGATTSSNYVPKAPTIGTAIANDGTSIGVTFTANSVNGAPATTSYTAVVNPGNITATSPSAGVILVTGLTPLTTYSAYVYATNAYGNSSPSASATATTYVASSSTAYTFPGTYSWIAPADVTSVSVVAVGAGGGGDGSGTASWFIGSASLQAGGGGGAGLSAGESGAASGNVAGRVGFSGGGGATGSSGDGGGGGAGGYAGVGGGGGGTGSGANGSGGGGGGGASQSGRSGGGGGGVGLFGLGGNGAAGAGSATRNLGGGGGSGGQAGGGDDATCNPIYLPRLSYGGFPGGGAGGGGNRGGGGGGALTYVNDYPVIPGNSYSVRVGTGGVSDYGVTARGGNGAVRIIWPGQVRSFPSTMMSGCGATTSSTYVPQAPTIGTATVNSGTRVTVTYTAPTWTPSPITSYTGVAFPGGITSTTATSESGLIVFDGLTPLTTYSFYIYATNYYGNSTTSSFVAATTYVANSSSSYIFPGSYTWIAPPDVTSVSAVAVGGGGGGSGSGSAGSGGNSTFISGTTLNAGGGGGANAGVYGGCGGAGGTFNYGFTGYAGGNGQTRGAGGGAGGYTGAGGIGGSSGSTGGGGGGGGYNSTTIVYNGGGGVGLFGLGGNGPLGATNSSGVGVAGGGGSGGLSSVNRCGGLFGGGGGGAPGGAGAGGGGGGGALAYINNFTVTPGSSYSVVVGARGTTGGSGSGASGGVRIVWPGEVRAFPSTMVSGCGATTSSTYVPQAPTIGTAVANSGTRITITYSANSDGGGPITSYTAVTNPGNIITSTATGGLIVVDNVNPLTTYSSYVYANNQYGSSVASGILSTTTYVANGSVAYTGPGTYSWIAPANVTAVSIVAVGGGGGGVTVIDSIGGGGTGGTGGDSYFAATCIARAYGGTGASVGSSGSRSNTGGRSGTGAAGIVAFAGGNGVTSGPGGGAAGYAGAGGAGNQSAPAGSGGGGGGVVKGGSYGGGGGVGLFGLGPDGAAGGTSTLCNQAGSGGSYGLQTPASSYGTGGQFGGGGAAVYVGGQIPNGGPGGGLVYLNNYTVLPGTSYTVVVGAGGSGDGSFGGGGAVRIVWPGQTRAFPNYNLVSGCGATTSSTYVPQAPTIGTAAANSGTSISITFSANSTGGSPITSYTAVTNPGNIINSTATAGLIVVSRLTPLTSYSTYVYATNQYGNSTVSSAVTTSTLVANGEAVYVIPGTYSWVAPTNVTVVSAVVVGAGGTGGAGGNYACGGSGGQSYFVSTSTVRANGGVGGRTSNGGGCLGGAGGTVGAGTGFAGGKGGTGTGTGGGAGGYTGAGGAGSTTAGTAGTGGGGGGGGHCTTTDRKFGGGGVGLFGLGANGAAGIVTSTGIGAGGGGGSGGEAATALKGGNYGGGGAGTNGGGGAGGGALSYINNISVTPGVAYTVVVGNLAGASDGAGLTGAGGAVRIIWPGTSRQFPSTSVTQS